MKTLLPPWHANHVRGVCELARVTGRSKCHISCVLRGQRKPSKELARVLRKLGYNLKNKGTL